MYFYFLHNYYERNTCVDITNDTKYELNRKRRAILDLIGNRFLTRVTSSNLGCPTVSSVFKRGLWELTDVRIPPQQHIYGFY